MDLCFVAGGRFLPITAVALGAEVHEFGEGGDFGGAGKEGQGQPRKTSEVAEVELGQVVFQMRG